MPDAVLVRLREFLLRVKIIDGELAGLEVDGELIPFPGVGVETELGACLAGAGGMVGAELRRVLEARAGVIADRSASWAWESDRVFDELGSTYLESRDHWELNTWFHRSAVAARANLEARLEDARAVVGAVGSPLILHATGADGLGNSWASLHVNVPISDRTYAHVIADQRAGAHLYDYHFMAQLTLAVVDGAGGMGEDGYLLSDRQGQFDRVFGTVTLRPSRAMIVDRSEGFGCCRIMNMLRALSFGRASAAGFLATQIDCLIMQLVTHGVLEIPAVRCADPIEAGRFFSLHENRRQAAAVQLAVQAVRRAFFDALADAVGLDVALALLPDAPELLDFIDRVLEAVAAGDEAALVATTDWARKHELVRVLVSSRNKPWADLRPQLMELNVHWARLDDRALRHRFAESSFPCEGDCAPVDTSSWLLHAVVARARHDRKWRESLDACALSWKGVSRTRSRWMEPVGGYYPYAARESRTLELIPWSHTRKTHGAAFEAAATVDELLEMLGTRTSACGSYAGETARN